MKLNKYFVIDFDSTFTKVEAFDVLADISLSDHPEKEARKTEIAQITNQGMDGSISFRESLERRLALLAPNKKHLPSDGVFYLAEREGFEPSLELAPH